MNNENTKSFPYVKLIFDFLMSVSGVIGCLMCLITAFGIEADATCIIWVSVRWCLILSLCFSLRKKIARIIAMVTFLLGSITAFFLMSEELVVGFKVAFSRLFIRFCRFVPELQPFLTENELAAVDYSPHVTIFFVFFSLFLSFVLTLCFVRTKAVFLPIALTVPFLAVCMFIINTVPDVWATAILIAFWSAALMTGFLRKSGKNKNSVTSLIVLLTVAVLVASLVTAISPESYERPDFFNDFSTKIENTLGIIPKIIIIDNNSLELSEESDVSEPDGLFAFESTDDIDLNKAGNIKLESNPALKVTTDYRGSMLIRGYSMGDYVNNKWLPLSENVLTASTGIFDENGRFTSQLLSSNALANQSYDNWHSMSITVLNTESNILYTPVNPLFLKVQCKGDDRQFYFVGNKDDDGYSYDISFICAYGDVTKYHVDGSLGSSESMYGWLTEQYYLQHPNNPTLEKAVIESGVTDDDSLYEKICKISNYVNHSAVYTLSPGKVPEGKDFVTYFLEENKRGYCTHFATAAALIFRQAGIPARFVTGYYLDEADPNISFSKRTVTITDNSSHAWVEVYCKGYGWIPVNVTPGFTDISVIPNEPIGEISVDTSGEVISEVSEELSESSYEESSETQELSEDSSGEVSKEISESISMESDVSEDTSVVVPPIPSDENSNIDFAALIIAFGSIALIVACFVLSRLIRLSVRRKHLYADAVSSTLYAWKYLQKLLPFGAVSNEEIYRTVQKARFSKNGVTAEEAQKVVSYALNQANELYTMMKKTDKLVFKYVNQLI